MKIGSGAPIGAKAKLGSKAWGESKVPAGGKILYDGKVTLAEVEDDELRGEIEMLEMPVGNRAYIVTINGHVLKGYAEEDEGEIYLEVFDEMTSAFILISDGVSTLTCASDVGHEGENTLLITEAAFFVMPSQVDVGVDESMPIYVFGEVQSYESSNTAVAVVLEYQGGYSVKGVALGSCTVTFVGTSGDTYEIAVQVVSIG